METSGRFFSAEEVRLKLENWCAYQDRSIYETKVKLHTFRLQEIEEDTIIRHLIDKRFLDDGRFAQSYAQGKLRIKCWGRKKIAMGLRQKGIARDILQQALEGLDETLYWEQLIALLEKKRRLLTGREKNAYMLRQKIMVHAQSKGFESELILEAMKQIHCI